MIQLFTRSPRSRTRPSRLKSYSRRIELVEQLEQRLALSASDPTTFEAPAGLEILPQASTGPSGYTPQQIRHAYGLDNIVQNGITLDGAGQTIAIVVAYDAPTIASDLQQFSATFGLPTANLTIVKQNVNGTLPAANATWAKETSLDVQWVHAIAPAANILLVEAIDASANLYTEAAWAAQQPGVSVVSMSFASFVSYSTGYDSAFVTPSGHQGVTFVAASGDRGNSGYPSNSTYSMYPADSPNVVGVGSTSLVTDASGNYVSESATSYSGGGYSLYESMPNYQINAGITTPGNMRANPDVSFVGGDGSKAIPIYDAYSYGASTPWGAVQGTSASTPMFAGLLALANQGRALAGKATLDGPSQTLPLLYQFQTSFHDITQGGNAAYQAGTGYDFVTGLGTPIGNILVPQLIEGGFLPLSAQGSFSISASAGAAFSNQELATFSDPNGNLATGMYSATINWGDGTSTTTGTIGVDSQSRLAVFGGHAYATAGNFTITVTISSSRSGAPAGTSVQSSANVSSGSVAPLSATGGFTVNATKGVAFSNQELATFSDPNGALATSSYSAVINWGDGTSTSSGVIAVDSQSKLAVFGGHNYANAGSFTITVTISSSRAGAPAGSSVQSTASVTAPTVLPLSSTGGFTVNATKGVAFNNQELATFSDPNGALATSSYSAVINWGDGTSTSSGTIGVDGQGKLAAFGGHTYASAGSFTITVTISSSRAGAPAGTSVQSTAGVSAPAVLPLSASGGFTLHPTKGVAFSNQELATFSDPNGALATGSYSAVVNWGDGTSMSSGVIAVDGQGKLAVFGGHTYVNAANFTITVTISSSRAGAPAGTSVQSTASVTAPAVSPLVAQGGVPINVGIGTALINQELATFSDPNGVLTTSAYSAAVDWGDGVTTSGVIATDLQDRMAVFADHTYAGVGAFTITITISSARSGAPAATAVHSTASISAQPANLTPTEYYVNAVYQVLLGRSATASERQGTAQQLNAGVSRTNFVNAVDHSDEYFHTLINADYLKYLGRAVDSAGQAYWTSQMKAGLTDESLEAGFVASAEYYTHCGGTDLDWVNHMYLDILGRAADPAGQANWIQFLAAGGSRRQVAFGFATSAERESQHIERNYEQYLGRSADAAGLQYWLHAFLQGKTNEDLITGFLASDEYFRTHSS